MNFEDDLKTDLKDEPGSRKIFWLLITLSVLFHVFVFFVMLPEFASEPDKNWELLNGRGVLPTQVLTEQQFQKMMSAARQRPIVESAPSKKPTPEELKKEARFLGERTQRVEKETVTSGFGSLTGGKGGKSGEGKMSADKNLLSKLGLSKGLSKFVQPKVEKMEVGEGGDDKLVRYGNLDSLPKDIAVGSDTILNTDEYVYASFYNRMKAEVAPRWEPLIQGLIGDPKRHITPGYYQTQTVFRLDRDGNVLDVKIEHPSGYVPFDEAAKTSIQLALRFKNPPAGLLDKDGFFRIQLGFVVNLANRGVQMNYVPDPRLDQ